MKIVQVKKTLAFAEPRIGFLENHDIRVELKDAQNRLVYSWTIRPEATSLPPHGSIEFNSAKLDVPVNSKQLVLSFSGEAAN